MAVLASNVLTGESWFEHGITGLAESPALQKNKPEMVYLCAQGTVLPLSFRCPFTALSLSFRCLSWSPPPILSILFRSRACSRACLPPCPHRVATLAAQLRPAVCSRPRGPRQIHGAAFDLDLHLCLSRLAL